MPLLLDDIESLSRIGSFTVDRLTDTVWWSANLYGILGLDPARVSPSLAAFIGLLNPCDANRARNDLDGFGPSSDTTPLRYRTHDDRALVVRLEVRTNAEGTPTLLIAVVSEETTPPDLHQRNTAKWAILEQTLAMANLGSWTWNLETDEVTWSDEFRRIMGIDPSTPPSREVFRTFTHPDDLEGMADLRTRVFETGVVNDIEIRILHPDGATRILAVKGQASADHMMIGVVHDITEERELQRRLRAHDRVDTVGRLASGIAHDFNNLLTVINANVQMLSDVVPSIELDDTLDAVARATRLTQQLGQLDLSRDEPQTAVDIGQLLSDMLPVIRDELRHTALHHDLRPGTIIDVRFGDLERAFIQLARNAREAGAANVWLANRDVVINGVHHAEITLRDDGEGMSPEVLARATEAFFSTRGPRSTGGIGLTIVRDTVDRSGGVLLFRSTVNEGTQVVIRWPAGSAEPVDHEPVIDVVLVIEDESSVRRVIRRILERTGRQVLEAADPEEAYTYMLRPLTLILSDVVMPRGGGRRVNEMRERLCPDVPLIFMSGYAGDAPWLADHEFVAKPFSLEAFETLLTSQTSRPSGGEA